MRRRSGADGSHGSGVVPRCGPPGMTTGQLPALHLQPLALRVVERFQTGPRGHLLVGHLDLEFRAVDQRLVDTFRMADIANANRGVESEAVAGGGDVTEVATIHDNGLVDI